MKLLKGFTLAEVLIVLGIIGVISALTMPTFTANANNAQIGPALGKYIASFEEGTTTYLANHNLSRLSDIPTESGHDRAYSVMNALRENIKWERAGEEVMGPPQIDYRLKDGTIVHFTYEEKTPTGDFANSRLPGDWPIGTLQIVLQGGTKNGTLGTKTFNFMLYDDGSIIPVGATNWDKSAANGGTTWQDACPNLPTKVANDDTGAYYCAGSIFEQGMKINYKIDR